MARLSWNTTQQLIAIIVPLAIVGSVCWLAWEVHTTAQAASRDSKAPDYLRAYAAAQAQYHAQHRSFATVAELHQIGQISNIEAESYEQEGYSYDFGVSPDRAHFRAAATPTWQKGGKPSHWYVDDTYVLRYAPDHRAGPSDAAVGRVVGP